MRSTFIVQRSQLVDITVNPTTSYTTINIPDQPMLRDKRVQAIEIYYSTDLIYSPVSGNALASGADLTAAGGSLTLYAADPLQENNSGEYLYRVPFASIHRIQNADNDPFVRDLFRVDDLIIQWDKCQIVFAKTYTPGAMASICLNVYYTSVHDRPKHAISGVGSDMWNMICSKIMSLEKKVEALFNNRK